MKLTNSILSGLIGLFSIAVMSDAIAEKMAAPTMVTSAEAFNYYKAEQKKRKLTSDESNIVKLVQVAFDVFKISDFVVDGYYQETDKEKHLSLHSVATQIQRSIKQNKTWDEPISNADMAKVKSVEELIKTSLGPDSYATAWLSYKNGNKTEAKTILDRGFEKAFDQAMKMDYIGFSDDVNPIQDAEFFSQALTPLSTKSENKSRAEKLRKAQVRASNLPQIMT